MARRANASGSTVIVGVDGSQQGKAAVQQAIEQCKRAGAKLVIVHVIEIPGTTAAASEGIAWTSMLPALREAAKTIVGQAVRAADDAGVAHAVKIIELKDPAVALVNAAEDSGASLIVVGSHGRTGLKRMLLGSVAERVVRYAHCPVLVVR